MDSLRLPVRGVMLAKGQSRRLTRKNMRDFDGRPMFAVNLQKMIDLGLDPILDSDDDEILAISRDMGATPHRRVTALEGPDVPTIPIVAAAFDGHQVAAPTCAVIVQANSPNVSPQTIQRAASLIATGAVTEIMSADPDRSHNGSVWAVSYERLHHYGDFYEHRPELLLVDDSIDIHHADEFDKALVTHAGGARVEHFDCRAPDPSISQAHDRNA